MIIFPSGGRAFAVVVGRATFPDEVVFVADGFDRFSSDSVEEAVVDGFVVGAGPT